VWEEMSNATSPTSAFPALACARPEAHTTAIAAPVSFCREGVGVDGNGAVFQKLVFAAVTAN
jgi:hypothetical protein